MIRENLDKINQKIAEICSNCGRRREEITLIAVSKNNPISAIEEALEAGQLDFGENKAQELRDKAEVKSDGLYWHFIGHLQSNKVKYAVRAAELIHSVDSKKVLEEINKRAANESKVQKILFEVNTSDETNKFGLKNYNALEALVEKSFQLDNVNPMGLMTMAPYTEDENIIRECFSQLREWKEKLVKKGFELSELSMGMTNDYKIAIEEGSTILRIGTAVFGERDYSQKWDEQ